ncbi:unnamed protein product [Ambrosiozyma monospora]|uniref:Unnamed protein product n=1 Tax=Ambrosiozyma monospora TaxID=43982 RepID=A0ACB5U2T8_AMBMO|nr:unnamed protein product [Ambrosiozyma monospora]
MLSRPQKKKRKTNADGQEVESEDDEEDDEGERDSENDSPTGTPAPHHGIHQDDDGVNEVTQGIQNLNNRSPTKQRSKARRPRGQQPRQTIQPQSPTPTPTHEDTQHDSVTLQQDTSDTLHDSTIGTNTNYQPAALQPPRHANSRQNQPESDTSTTATNITVEEISPSRYALFRRCVSDVYAKLGPDTSLTVKFDTFVGYINELLNQEDKFSVGEARRALAMLEDENIVMFAGETVYRI